MVVVNILSRRVSPITVRKDGKDENIPPLAVACFPTHAYSIQASQMRSKCDITKRMRIVILLILYTHKELTLE